MWQFSVVVSMLSSVHVVNRHQAQLLFGWVIACGQPSCVGV